IQNGAGMALTKIGLGTENLTGANTYNGDTIIKAGKLGTTTASSGGGNFSVSNNAALGVTTATPGGTLAINNLTMDSSSALQLNAGAAGNPSAAIVPIGGAFNLNGNATISIAGPSRAAGGPFTVLTYTPANRTGPGVLTMVNSPRVVAIMNDNTNTGVVTVTI